MMRNVWTSGTLIFLVCSLEQLSVNNAANFVLIIAMLRRATATVDGFRELVADEVLVSMHNRNTKSTAELLRN